MMKRCIQAMIGLLLASVAFAEIPAVKFDPPAVKFPKVEADKPIPFAFAPSDFQQRQEVPLPQQRAGFRSGDFHAGREPQHSHICGRCGYEFWHGASGGEGYPSHRCPKCNSGPWTTIQRRR